MRQEPTRVLIVQPQGVGDAIMLTPAITGLRAHRPSPKIAVAVRTATAAEAVADLCDAVFHFDWRADGPRNVFRTIRTIRTEFKPDACIVAPYVSALYAEPFAYAVGARLRVGANSVWRWGGYTHVKRDALHQHKVTGLMDCVREIFPDCPEGRPAVSIGEEAEHAAEEIWRSSGLDGARVLGIHPGTDASGRMRRYPPEYYLRVIRYWTGTNPGARVMVFLGPGEAELKRTFNDVAGVTFAEGFSIRTVAALISRTAVFLGSDSALVHVAAAVGVPVTTIFGPANPDRTRPWTTRGRVVRFGPTLSCMPCIDHAMYTACRARPCLSSLSPSTVFRTVDALAPEGCTQ